MQGIWTVIPTIFKFGTININDMKKLIDTQIMFKIDGIVFNGTTSEVSTLYKNEKTIIYNLAREYKGIVQIMIGVGGNDTREIEDTINECKDACDYIMLTVPYYNKP